MAACCLLSSIAAHRIGARVSGLSPEQLCATPRSKRHRRAAARPLPCAGRSRLRELAVRLQEVLAGLELDGRSAGDDAGRRAHTNTVARGGACIFVVVSRRIQHVGAPAGWAEVKLAS